MIVETGKLSGLGRKSVDASGLIVAPGFIDTHRHYDADPLGQRDHAILLSRRNDRRHG